MNKLLIVFAVFLLVVFLFVYTLSQKSPGIYFGIQQKTPSVSGTASLHSSKTNLVTDIIPLRIQHGKVTPEARMFQIQYGHMIVLQISSDEDGDFYLQGYKKHVFLHKGQMVVLSFLSTIHGSFLYELANAGKQLGILKVTP